MADSNYPLTLSDLEKKENAIKDELTTLMNRKNDLNTEIHDAIDAIHSNAEPQVQEEIIEQAQANQGNVDGRIRELQTALNKVENARESKFFLRFSST